MSMGKDPKKPKAEAKAAEDRTPTGQFVKGKYKGGPGGPRANGGRKPKEITELHAELFSPETARAAAGKLLDAVRGGDLEAIKYTLDRVFGKPKQSVEADIRADATFRAVVQDINGNERHITSLREFYALTAQAPAPITAAGRNPP